MKYHFISDDGWFLSGLQDVVSHIGSKAFFINTNDENIIFSPSPGDVVVMAVNHVRLRSHLMKEPTIAYCRLILILDMPVTSSGLASYPWLMPKNIGTAEFKVAIRKAEKTSVHYNEAPLRTLSIFNQLGRGIPPADLIVEETVSLKSIYRIKNNVFQEYGLLGCNSAGVLVCRDILGMKVSL